ncbi:MAG: DUF2255 family protein [Myxococcota bacterium]
MTTSVLRSWALLLGLVLFSAQARAQALNWIAFADEDVIEILSHDPDGELRETKVWVGVIDGVGYVRTSDTRWHGNIAAEPNVVVRVGGVEYPLRAELVKDASLRARVNEVFRAKYGFTDRMLGWFGNDGGKYCLALVPRPASP